MQPVYISGSDAELLKEAATKSGVSISALLRHAGVYLASEIVMKSGPIEYEIDEEAGTITLAGQKVEVPTDMLEEMDAKKPGKPKQFVS